LNVPSSVHGAAIEQIRPGSPAEDAGLQPGDVIMEVNRHPATSVDQVANELHNVPNGKNVLLLVWSNGGTSYRVVTPNQG